MHTYILRTAWKAKGNASLLQLDLAGAFSRVHHGWLLAVLTLTEAGFAPELVRWLSGWLENRSAKMLVDGCQALLKLYVTELDPRSSIVDTVPFWVTWYWCQSSVTSVLTTGWQQTCSSRLVSPRAPRVPYRLCHRPCFCFSSDPCTRDYAGPGSSSQALQTTHPFSPSAAGPTTSSGRRTSPHPCPSRQNGISNACPHTSGGIGVARYSRRT